MTPKEQIITIAEASGYERKPQHDAVWGYKGMKIYGVSNLPNYLNDLNAIHEAWSMLNKADKGQFITELFRVTQAGLSEVYNATASQRAEAFLRTIGKWS